MSTQPRQSESADARVSRRSVLGSSASLAAASLLTGQASASSRVALPRPVFIQVFMRLGMDGLSLFPPHGDFFYYERRPTLAIQPPGVSGGALDLDGFFGLAPAAAGLMTPYGNGHLLVTHATGSQSPTRSHFEAFAHVEIADPSLPPGVLTKGWLSRYLTETAGTATSQLRAISASGFVPLTLRGAQRTLPIPNFQNFDFPGRLVSSSQRQDAIREAYMRLGPPVGPAALDTLASFGLGGVDFAAYVPENGAVYPDTVFGKRMRSIAALIKADTGVELYTVDIEGWDLHANLGPHDGSMARLMNDLGESLQAFYLDMLAYVDDYVLVALSEFGRKLAENDSAGTDHGHGSSMLVMGGHVNGGRVLANWPGLGPDDLDNGDVAVTIDYRDILGEVIQERLGVNPVLILPHHTFTNHDVIV